jgi:carbamoyltransferase
MIQPPRWSSMEKLWPRWRRSGSAARNTAGEFPAQAISYCLREAGIRLEHVDEIAHGFNYRPFKSLYSLHPQTARLYDDVLSPDAFIRNVNTCFPEFPAARIRQVQHHLSHAASAHFTSGSSESLVVVIDAMGEAESISVYHANGDALKLLHAIPSRKLPSSRHW